MEIRSVDAEDKIERKSVALVEINVKAARGDCKGGGSHPTEAAPLSRQRLQLQPIS